MTLSQAAILTKQVITLSTIAIVVGLVSFIGYKIWHTYYLAHLPPVEEKPDTKFGLLPSVDFPKSAVSSSNYSYSIDTATGNLPKVGTDSGFGKIIKVYFITKIYATLLSADRAKILAEKFDIKTDPKILSETNYQFQDKDKTLTVNLDNGNFTFEKEASLSGTESLDNDNKLTSDFKKNLESLGVLKNDLNSGRSHILLLKNAGGTLTTTELRSEAVAAQISLWPADINKIPIYTSQFDTSLINAIVYKSADNLQNYLSINFTYYPIDTSTFATYPIKTAAQAFEDLKSGKGIVAIEPTTPKVSISSIYLAYFLGDSYSPYLQPIFVFEGPHFAAYVPAISEQFQSPTK